MANQQQEPMSERVGFQVDPYASNALGNVVTYALSVDAQRAMPADARPRFEKDDGYSRILFGLPAFLDAFANLQAERSQMHRSGVFSWKNLSGAGESLRRQSVLDFIMGKMRAPQSRGENSVVHVIDGNPELRDVVNGPVRYDRLGGVVATKVDYSGKLVAFGVANPESELRTPIGLIGFGQEARIFKMTSDGVELLIPLSEKLGKSLQEKTDLAGHDLYLRVRYIYKKLGKSKLPTHLVLGNVEMLSCEISDKGMIKSGRLPENLLFGEAGNTLGVREESIIGQPILPNHGPITGPREVTLDLARLLSGSKLHDVPKEPKIPREVVRQLELENERVYQLFRDKRFVRFVAPPVDLQRLAHDFTFTLNRLFGFEHRDNTEIEPIEIRQLRELVLAIGANMEMHGESERVGRPYDRLRALLRM